MSWLSGRWRRVAIAALAVVVLFGAVGALAIPAAARWALETVVSRELGRTVSVESIAANPYTLRVTLRGLQVSGAPGESSPLATLREASFNASMTSLFRLAPVADEIAIDGLTINIVRLQPHRFNFSDIVERLNAKAKPSDEPVRFSLANIQVTGSTVNFDDHVTAGRHAATDVRIGIPFLSSLPTDAEIKVQPAFAAKINGTRIDLRGETRPFHDTLESSIVLKLEDLDIAKYLAYSPVELNFEVPAGTLDTDLRVAFQQAVAARKDRPARPAQTLVSGVFRVNNFALVAPAVDPRVPLVAWKTLAVNIHEFEPLQRRLVLGEIALTAPEFNLTRDSSGVVNWQRFAERPVAIPSDNAAPSRQAGAASPRPYAVTVRRAVVNDGRLKFIDQSVGRFEQDVINLQAEAHGLTTAARERGQLKLSADIKENGSVTLDGDIGLAPLAGQLKVSARDVRLAASVRYLAQVINGTLDGASQVDGVLEFADADSGTQIRLRDIALAGKDIKFRGPEASGAMLDIAAVQIVGGELDLTGRRIAIERLTVDAPRLAVSRLNDGAINWQRVGRATDEGSHQASATAPWQFRLKQADITRGELVLEDRAVEPAVKLRASALAATVTELAGDGSERAVFSLRTRFGSGGTLAVQGNARWDALSATVRLDARNLDVATLRPYLAERLDATLARGELSARGVISATQSRAGSPLELRYTGTARLANLHALDGAGESDLLKWQVFDMQGVDITTGDSAPLVALGKLTLSDFYARVIVSENGRLNLADLVKRTEESGTASAAPAGPAIQTAPVAGAAEAATTRPTIRIGAIELVRGNVNFTDNFIKPNYTANMTDLGGTVTSLASDSSEPATMTLAGRIDNDAPLEISGRLNPLAPTLYLDIEGRTKGVDLPRLTPYSVKYAGYPITKGKLSMDVKYKIEAQKLTASNHLFLDQLTFGERIDSPTATKLPVLLAVSLLKNTRGEIDINLPISGSLDDPQFSVGGIIVQVIVNLLTKIVTAPFALLASAFGTEELGFVEFAPGASALAAPQRQRLDTLAKALNDRPGLKLDIIGRVDPVADADGVRRAKVESKLRAAKVRQLTRGGGESVDPAKVAISADERPALIATVYADEKIPDKPRNLIGLAKSIPAPEMEQLILKNMTATSDDLRALATARAAAVRDHLEGNGKVGRDRLFLVEPKLTAEGIQDKGAPTRVDFALK
jgi:uncharacterized protein involved in outer membrane biogenesis